MIPIDAMGRAVARYRPSEIVEQPHRRQIIWLSRNYWVGDHRASAFVAEWPPPKLLG